MLRTLLIAACSLIVAGATALAETSPAYILVDVGRGTVLAHDDSDRRWPPASVTKVMTAYLTFKALKSGQLTLSSPVVISANASKEPPSKMGYKPGTVITVDNALKMMLVRSANDIAIALAETVGGSLFGPYLIAVELASLLLLAGLVGACHLGMRGDDGERSG